MSEVLDVTQPVESDRVYCRNDDGLVHDAITEDTKYRCYFGLRRFGKTSFLKKIERYCRTKPQYKHAHAHFLSVINLDRQVLAAAAADAKSLKKNKDGRVIVLLDDLREVEKQGEDRETKNKFERFMDDLKKLQEFPNVYFIISEPTSLGEYLYPDRYPPARGDKGRNRYGRRFGEFFPENIVSGSYRLNRLSIDETRRILCDKITRRDAPRKIEQGFIDRAYAEFGGNPWLLAHARALIDDNAPLAKDFEELEKSVFLRTTEGQARNLLDTVYGSLGSDEKFILKVLRSVETGRGEGAASLQGTQYWKDGVRDIAKQMRDLGLIDASDGYPRQIIASSLKKVVDDMMDSGDKSPFDESYKDVKNIWFHYLKPEHPDQSQRGELVIHQLSDILFGLDSDPETSTFAHYKAFLKHLHKEDSPDRPHFIVICGNLISGQKQGGRSARYQGELEHAIDEIMLLRKLLRPIGEADRPADSKQIILVPGLYDLLWTKGFQTHRECRKHWDSFIESAGLSTCTGESLTFERTPVGEILFLPMDSLSVDGVMEQLGGQAVDDIMDIRRAIQNICHSELGEWLKNPERAADDEYSFRARFIDQTMRYIVGFVPPEEDGREAVEGPTFKWYAAPDEPRYSDVGFLSDQDLKMIRNCNQGDKGRIKIGIIHHHPYQHNPSPVAEFFESVRLRRVLANSDVQLLLHGHSPLQCIRTEVMSSYHHHPREPEDPGAGRRLRMITSGAFSQEANYFVETEAAECIAARPSFNLIRLQPGDDGPSDSIRVVLEVFEMTGDIDEGDVSFQKAVRLASFSLTDEE